MKVGDRVRLSVLAIIKYSSPDNITNLSNWRGTIHSKNINNPKTFLVKWDHMKKLDDLLESELEVIEAS